MKPRPLFVSLMFLGLGMAPAVEPGDLAKIQLSSVAPLDALHYLHQQESFEQDLLYHGFDPFEKDWFSTNQSQNTLRLAYLPRFLNLEYKVRTAPPAVPALAPAREIYLASLVGLCRVLQGVLDSRTRTAPGDLMARWASARKAADAHRAFIRQLQGSLP